MDSRIQRLPSVATSVKNDPVQAASAPELPWTVISHILKFAFPGVTTASRLVNRSWYLAATLMRTSSCGHKYDNLVKAKLALSGSGASVPPFFGFTDPQIKACLSPETCDRWHELAQQGLESPPESFQKLQVLVERDVLAAPLPLKSAQREMLAAFSGEPWLIRSSSDEDGVDIVNAGGNETIHNVTPTEEQIKKALAKVIASYFSYRSLKNRSASADPFKQMPKCSALVMVQIMEALNSRPVVSGVMMTHKSSWFRQREGRVPHIVASWGFGGGVVSGRTPGDEWVLTDQQCYATIRCKTHRTVALPSGETATVSNPLALQDSPCLSKTHLERLQDAGRRLEEVFRRPMDVEFVVCNDELYVVQARPAKAPEMSYPTFIDLKAISSNASLWWGTTLFSGSNQAHKVFWENVLFAKDLEEADAQFRKDKHKAVFIHTPPMTSNTHAEVNLSSQEPPVSCFLLPLEAWHSCQVKDLYLCPQRGLLVIAAGDPPPVRKGLIQHPAQRVISIDGLSPALQSAISSQDWVKQIHEHLGRLGEQIAVRELTTAIHESLQGLKIALQHVFTDIADRRAARTAQLQPVVADVKSMFQKVMDALQIANEARCLTLLSFHAGAFKQLLQQQNRQVVGAHSLLGVDAATQLPECVETFLSAHADNAQLSELALFAKKAWDEPIQQKWLTFIEKHQNAWDLEQGVRLVAHVRELDAVGMLPLWFSIHFSQSEPAALHDLLPQHGEGREFLDRCLDFTRQWRQLADRVERLGTLAELHDCWQALQMRTDAYLRFCAKYPTRNLLQAMQVSRLSYDLIQLWDAQIKVVKTSRLLSQRDTDEVFNQRIHQFAQFGLSAIEHRAIAVDMPIQNQLKEVLEKVARSSANGLFSDFSVQRWIVPLSNGQRLGFPSDDARFTVIHQNLLRASAFPFTRELLRLLPATLANAVVTFQKGITVAKGGGRSNTTFISILEESAAVTINIPLNLHSCIVTMQLNRGSNAVEFHAYWTGSDNSQCGYLGFIQPFCAATGVILKDSMELGLDLRVVLSAIGSQVDLTSRAIHHINDMSLTNKDYFRGLIWVLHPRKLKSGHSIEEWNVETQDTRARVVDMFWQQLVKTGDLPPHMRYYMKGLFDRDYLVSKGLMGMVEDRVIAELEGRRPLSLFGKRFLNLILETQPEARKKELLWLARVKGVKESSIPELYREDFIRRLYREEPKLAVDYFYSSEASKPDFEALMRVILAEGDAERSKEQEQLFRRCRFELQ